MASMDYLENLAFQGTRGHLAVMDEMVLREAWEVQEMLDPRDLLASKVARENGDIRVLRGKKGHQGPVAIVGNPYCLLI